jgi:type IV fimbrial biogenesis protein FimT
MVTIAIVAIFSSLAAPSFRKLIAAQRTRSAASALTESLWLARSESIKRDDNVTFKFNNTGTNTVVSAWEVTQSTNGTGTSLHHQDGFPSVLATTSTGSDVLFTFNRYGRLAAGSGWVKLGVPGANVYRWVCVSASGRATVQETACT